MTSSQSENPELSPAENPTPLISSASSGEVKEINSLSPRKSVGRPKRVSTPEQLEKRRAKRLETSARHNAETKNKVNERNSIKSDLEEFKKMLLERLPSIAPQPTKEKDESINPTVIKQEVMPPTNPEVKPPAPKPRVLTKEEKIKMALFGRI